MRVASNENAIVSFRMEVAPPDRPHGGAQGAVDHPQRRGVPGRLEPGARAGRPQRSRPRQALRLGPPRRLHRLQARDRPGREPVGDAGGRPVGDRRRCASSRRPRGPRCGSTASSSARRRCVHDAVRRRSRGRVPPQGLLRPQGDDEGRRRPREALLGRPEADPDRPIARAGRASGGPQMSSFGARVNPVGGVTVDFGLGYPWYFDDPGDGRRAGLKNLEHDSASTWASSSRRCSTSPTSRCAARCSSSTSGPLRVAVRRRPRRRHRRQRPRRRSSSTPTSIASLAFADVATVSAYGALLGSGPTASARRRPSSSNGVTADAYCGYPPTNDATQATMLFGNGPDHRTRASAGTASTSASRPSAVHRPADLGLLPVRVRPVHPTSSRFKPRHGVRGTPTTRR